jgi:hypothetical protein
MNWDAEVSQKDELRRRKGMFDVRGLMFEIKLRAERRGEGTQK